MSTSVAPQLDVIGREHRARTVEPGLEPRVDLRFRVLDAFVERERRAASTAPSSSFATGLQSAERHARPHAKAAPQRQRIVRRSSQRLPVERAIGERCRRGRSRSAARGRASATPTTVEAVRVAVGARVERQQPAILLAAQAVPASPSVPRRCPDGAGRGARAASARPHGAADSACRRERAARFPRYARPQPRRATKRLPCSTSRAIAVQ